MKKLICLLAFSGLLLTSCSSSDDSSTNEDGVLVRRSIETYANDGSVVTADYTYNGKKMVMVSDSDGYYEKYIYTGDLVTRIEFYDFDDVLEETADFAYNGNGDMISEIRTEPLDNLGSKEIYTYNSDGTISIAIYSGTATSQTIPSGTGTINVAGGEVTMIQQDQSGFITTHSYTYDTKNSPFKNVTGFDKLKFMGTEATGGVLHNVLTDTRVEEFFGSSATTITNSVYTYNAMNYPLTWVETEDGNPDTTISTQYIYN